MGRTATTIREMYDALLARFGPQDWWPAESPTEMIIGAILTQNTAWKNVERAIANLRRQGLLDLRALHATPIETLAELIRPAGYYNIKARRLMNLVDFLCRQYDCDLDAFFALPVAPAAGGIARRLGRRQGDGRLRSSCTPPASRPSSSTPTPHGSSAGTS